MTCCFMHICEVAAQVCNCRLQSLAVIRISVCLKLLMLRFLFTRGRLPPQLTCMKNTIISLHLVLERRKNSTPPVFLLLLGLCSTCSICLLFSVVVFSPCRKQQPYWASCTCLPALKSQSVFNELCICGSQPEAFHYWPVGISFSSLWFASLLALCFYLLIILSFRLIGNGVVLHPSHPRIYFLC